MLERPTVIKSNIANIVSKQKYIGFSVNSDSFAISYDDLSYVCIFNNEIKDDILLLINSENVEKLVFSKTSTLEILTSLLPNISCNAFVDLYDLAKSKNRVSSYRKIKSDLKVEKYTTELRLSETETRDINIALEAYYALSAYEEIIIDSNSPLITPPADTPFFDSFCLFSLLNLINSELSKGTKGKAGGLEETNLINTIREIEFNSSLEGNPLPCELNDDILDFLIDNQILSKKGKIIKLPEIS